MNSLAKSLSSSNYGFCINFSALNLMIFFLIASLLFPVKRFLPVSSFKVITPIDQISTFSFYIRSLSFSGDLYSRDPQS